MLTALCNRYAVSKLFQIFMIRKLATVVDPSTATKPSPPNPIVINSLDPCFCKSELVRDIPAAVRPVFKLFSFLFARTAEEGSRCVVIASSSGRESHGGYMRVGASKEYAPMITTKEGRDNEEYVWEQLEKKLKAIHPGIFANLAQ